MTSETSVSFFAIVGLAFGLVGCQDAMSSNDGPPSPNIETQRQAHSSSGSSHGKITNSDTLRELAEAKNGTAAYRDFKKGEDDYVKLSGDGDGMGYHYIKKSLIGSDKAVDWNRGFDFGSKQHRKNPGTIMYNDDGNPSGKMELVGVEYVAPYDENGSPPDLFSGNHDEWHVFPPRVQDLPPRQQRLFRSIDGACNYESGAGALLATIYNGAKVALAGGKIVGRWSGSVGPSACPSQGPGGSPLLVFHEHIWTLHAWLWKTNPEGMFAPRNPAVK